MKFIFRSLLMVFIQIITIPLLILPFIGSVFLSIVRRQSLVKLLAISLKYTIRLFKWEFNYMNTGELPELKLYD